MDEYFGEKRISCTCADAAPVSDQVPDPTLEDASLPTNRDKFMQSQTMFLILLISIKAVNILFLDSSLQMDNLCLYKKNYKSTTAL